MFSCKFLKFLRTQFFIEHDRWLLLPSKKLKNTLSSFLESSFSSSKKINNVLCIFSLPCFAVHNRKLSKEMCFMLPDYFLLPVYTGLYTGPLRKRQLLRFFVERFNRRSLKKISCDFPVWCNSIWSKKVLCTLFLGYTGLRARCSLKEAISCFFR